MVEQALTELAYAIQVRQEKVDQFRAEETSVEVTTQAYFGLKRRDGNTDSLYHDSMVAITQYTDDIAFFSAELADELQVHAVRVRQKLLKFADRKSTRLNSSH